MRTAIVIILSLLGIGLNAQSTSLQHMRRDVEVLASDSLGGRPPASIYEDKTIAYIARRFKEQGIEYRLQDFAIRLNKDDVIVSSNVVASINNKADSTIILTAHYDHLGMGNNKSLEIRRKGIHHGADDNASGVAMMLELASQLKANKSSKYNYLFIALGAHETGLYGSYNLTRSQFADSIRIKLLINLDMVGRLSETEKRIKVSYCTEQPSLKLMFPNLQNDSLRISFDVEGRIANDYNIFCEHCIPAVNITTGIHDDYHRISDTADKINYNGMVRVLEYLKKIIE